MLPEELKEMSRRYFEVWGSDDPEAQRKAIADDVVDHNAFVGFPQGIEGHRQRIRLFASAFSEWRHELILQLAEGDLVAQMWHGSGIHSGDLLGVPGTGKPVSMCGIDVMRFAPDGRLVDIWHQEDLLGVFQQIGVDPPPASQAIFLR